jgi:hypothetical protein
MQSCQAGLYSLFALVKLQSSILCDSLRMVLLTADRHMTQQRPLHGFSAPTRVNKLAGHGKAKHRRRCEGESVDGGAHEPVNNEEAWNLLPLFVQSTAPTTWYHTLELRFESLRKRAVPGQTVVFLLVAAVQICATSTTHKTNQKAKGGIPLRPF